MTTLRGTRGLVRAASAGALGLTLLAVCAQGSARAEDDDNSPSIWNLDQRLWRGFMSAMGVQVGTEVGLDYRERAPLVVPPQTTLPPPQAAPAKSAAWPTDPDVKRRQEAAKSKPRTGRGWDSDYEGRALTPSELNPPGTRGNPVSSSGSNVPTRSDGDPVLPSELGYFGGLFTKKAFGFGLITPDYEVGTFKSEPPRVSLTAPPVGYQTPSPEQPYGVTKRVEWDKPKNIYEDHPK
jgi:hypothetical protein